MFNLKNDFPVLPSWNQIDSGLRPKSWGGLQLELLSPICWDDFFKQTKKERKTRGLTENMFCSSADRNSAWPKFSYAKNLLEQKQAFPLSKRGVCRAQILSHLAKIGNIPNCRLQ